MRHLALLVMILPARAGLVPDAPATQPAATQPAEAQPASRPTLESLRVDLADPSPRKRAEAVEGLLAMGAQGELALIVETRRLVPTLRETLIAQAKACPKAAAAALEAYDSWQKAVQETIRLTRRTPQNDPAKSRNMLQTADRAVEAFGVFRGKLLTARDAIEPIEAGVEQLNQYEQARQQADRSYRPPSHSLHALVRAGGGEYPMAFQKVFAEQRKMDQIEQWVQRHNAKHKAQMEPQEYRCLALLNAYRRKMDRVPLAFHSKLHDAARQHSKEMYDLSYFSHRSPVPAYATVFHRAAMAGYGRFQSVAENIAVGFSATNPSAERMHRGWQDSPSHHLKMLNPTWREAAVGRQGRYWTQMFGLRYKNPWDGSEAPPPQYIGW